MGARLEHLVREIIRNGGVRTADAPLAALMLGVSALRAPCRLLERARFAWLSRRAGPTQDPVFIVGYWRTGTTHLHNLLGCSPHLGHISPLASGLPDEILTLGTWLAPWLEKALPEDRHVDRVAVRPDSPQEDEIPLANLQPLSIFQALYFPREFAHLAEQGIFFNDCTAGQIERWRRLHRDFVNKIAVHQGKPRLLIKNPVYTARIRQLREIWPGARFVHIYRNPYQVYVSCVHYYRRMLAELALQDYAHVDIEAFVLDTFARMMARYDEESSELPGEHLVEVSYESLLEAPLAVLDRIHQQLGLPVWETTEARVRAYMESIRGYRTNDHTPRREDIERVRHAWGAYAQRWGYRPPEVARQAGGVPEAMREGAY